MIRAYTGETVKFESDAYESGVLDTAVAKFAMKNQETGVIVVEKDCSIVDDKITVKLDSDETVVAGKYMCEIRIKVNDETDSVLYQRLILTDAIMKVI